MLETNYDWWVEPPFFDDRRHPAEDVRQQPKKLFIPIFSFLFSFLFSFSKCLNKLGPDNYDIPHLYNVLSSKPNFNLLTTYTTLMQVSTGRFEGYLQQCELPCPYW